MSLQWWQLPGPRQFVENLIEDLREGWNLIVCLPPHAPGNLRSAVRETWHTVDEARFRTIDLRDFEELEQNPLELLYYHFLPGTKAPELRTIEELLSAEELAYKIIWLNGLKQENHQPWEKFLKKYRDLSRKSDAPQSHAVFVLTFENDLAVSPPAEDLGLVVHRWRDIISELDALLYAASLRSNTRESPLQRRLSVNLMANLALWDLDLNERLADESFANLCAPQEFLKNFAAERNWHTDISPKWELGTADEIDGKCQPHSALPASHEKHLPQRIWRAQVAVLFPYVEECRQELIKGYSNHLPTWLKSYGARNSLGEFIYEVSDLHELEIGNLAHLFKNAKVNPGGIKIEDLRHIRNELAHLRPLPPIRLRNL